MGGKRRKATGGPLKKESKYKIPSRFDCPLCDAKSSIAVRLFRATGEATVYCRVCKVGQGRRWTVLPLEAAVDVFFRFREELTNLDQQYLAGQQQQEQGVTLAHSDNAQGSDGSGAVRTVRSLAELSHVVPTRADAHGMRNSGTNNNNNDADFHYSKTTTAAAHDDDDDDDAEGARGLQLVSAPLDGLDDNDAAGMSDAGKAPRLPRHRAAFVRQRVRQSAHKEHGYDARNYHQNVNKHGIHALTTFTCPICQCKNTVRVELNRQQQLAVVKCSYCVALEPRPADLPYPFVTSFVPKLENKADAFFRFSEAYRRLLNENGTRDDGGNDDDEDDEEDDDNAVGGDKDEAHNTTSATATTVEHAPSQQSSSSTADVASGEGDRRNGDIGADERSDTQHVDGEHDDEATAKRHGGDGDEAADGGDDDVVDDVTAFFDEDD